MGVIEKLKDFINGSDEQYPGDGEDYIENYPEDDGYGAQEDPAPVKSFSDPAPSRPSPSLVDIRSSSKTPVVIKKIDKYQDVQSVADVLNEKRIVVLNLESCPNDVSQRVIDFLSGVAYANSGDIKKIAGRAYIITPDSVPLAGDLLENLESGSFGAGYFES